MKNAPGTMRNVLECGSPPPLFHRRPESARGLAHSKTWRSIGARNLFRFGVRSPEAVTYCPLPERFERRSGLKSALLALCLLPCALCSPAFAQNFSLDWFTLDGGGGTSTGGVFAVSGTIGQPDASAQPMTGGSFSLTGGFWSLFAVQTAGMPLLTIRLTSANAAIVSWPSPSAGFILQQNADLNTTNWLAAPQSVSDNGTNRFIIVNSPAGNHFYRLFKP